MSCPRSIRKRLTMSSFPPSQRPSSFDSGSPSSLSPSPSPSLAAAAGHLRLARQMSPNAPPAKAPPPTSSYISLPGGAPRSHSEMWEYQLHHRKERDRSSSSSSAAAPPSQSRVGRVSDETTASVAGSSWPLTLPPSSPTSPAVVHRSTGR